MPRRVTMFPNLTIILLFIQCEVLLSTPLIGVPKYCPHEGAKVKVSLVGANSCLMCFCKNHIVQCNPQSCPILDSCYRLRPRKDPECCPTCAGCLHNGHEFLHGNISVDKCLVNECQAGVMTTSQKTCYRPCSDPLPPTGNECCPKCPDCLLEGKRVAEGKEVSPELDPCVKCSCINGQLTCSKKACPVLSCPPYKVIMGPDGCCPVCNGSREIFVPPGGRCFLGKYLYQTGDNRTFDVCTTCTCNQGYLMCKRKTCPPLICPRGYIHKKENECCSSCANRTQIKICMHAGVRRQHGDIWKLDKCTSCSCTHGHVFCKVQCEYLAKDCPVGTTKKRTEGACCPQCIENPGVCMVYGQPHFKTFDNYFFDFHGDCRYELAKDCSGRKSFKIMLNNNAKNNIHYPLSRSLSLQLTDRKGRRKVSLSQKLRTKVDYKRIKLPYYEESLNITRKGYLLTLTAAIGLQIVWDGAGYIEIQLDSGWRNKTCGLCGNFNTVIIDDKKTKKGELVLTSDTMAASWRSGRVKSCYKKHVKQLPEMQNDESYRNNKQIRTQRLTCSNSQTKIQHRCDILNGTYFRNCHVKVPMESFYKSCLLDLCECAMHRKCECDSISAYARECERAEVDISKWKINSKCGGLECPYGSVYMKCAPACKPSCKNQTPNPNCHMRRCKSGCYCPPPTVLHRGVCVLPENCPARYRKIKSRY